MLVSRWVLLGASLGVLSLSTAPFGEEANPPPPKEEPKGAAPAPDAKGDTSRERRPEAGDTAGEAVRDEAFERAERAARRALERRRRRSLPDDRDIMLVPWGWYPWYGAPQTFPRYEYPPSITHVPRLGLQYNYPFAYQMGFQVPVDSDPLTEVHSPASLGPFVGVVGAAKAAAAMSAHPSGADEAIPLIREKKYKEAGRRLAEGYRETDDPRYPILLAEVFFLLGKFDHADAILRDALSSEGALDALPDDLSSHLADPEELEKRIGEAGDDSRLITAYMLVHSKSPERGTDLLQKRAAGDKAAALLYRRYLTKAFQDPSALK